MPIYEYRCTSCGVEKEYLQKVSEPLLTDCPDCGRPTLEKLVSAAGFQLKGNGWYVTDFRNKGGKPQTKGSGDGEAATATPPASAEKPAQPKEEAKPA